MEYKNWALEYREQERVLKEKIDKLKKERKIIQSSELRKKLEDRIYVLYGMYLDCVHIAELLEGRALENDKEKLRGA